MALGLTLVGCEIGFVDRGGSFVADNRSDVAVLARIKSTVRSEAGAEIAYTVVELPASSRLVIAIQGFADDKEINGIEVLTESCESIGNFFGFTKSGRLIQIDNGPTATLVPEWPQDTDPKAEEVGACPSPAASPTP
jgi:hypothetical protein